MQVIYAPRQTFVQRVSAAAQIPIRDVGIRRDAGVGSTAKIIITLPSRVHGTAAFDLEFVRQPMPTDYTAVEDAAECVLRFFHDSLNIFIDDVNYKTLKETEHSLLAAEAFQMLHQEAAQDAIAALTASQQSFSVLMHEHCAVRMERDQLKRENDGLKSDFRDVQQMNGGLQQRNNWLEQRNAVLKQQNTGTAQDLENTKEQYRILNYAHGQHEHAGSQRRKEILRGRYLDAIDRAYRMAQNSPVVVPIKLNKGIDAHGKPFNDPVYDGTWPPQSRREKTTLSMVSLAHHKRGTDQALLL